MEKILSVTEFAKRLKVSRIAIHAWIKKGKIKCVRLSNYFVIPEAELKKWNVRPDNITRKLVRKKTR